MYSPWGTSPILHASNGGFAPPKGGYFLRLDRSDEVTPRDGGGLGAERAPTGKVDRDRLVVLHARAPHGQAGAAGHRADGEQRGDRGAAQDERFEIGVR